MTRTGTVPDPQFRLHKGSGRAYANVDGRRVYFGQHDDPAAREAYDRHIAEWKSLGQSRPQDAAGELTVIELCDAFLLWAAEYYRRPDGTRTNEATGHGRIVRELRTLYGRTRARDFGPIALRTVRDKLIALGWCRGVVNQAIGRVRFIFKWGVGRQLIPPTVIESLRCVEGLSRGRSKARESEPVRPVPEATVDKTLEHCTPTVAAMIRLQSLTGMRPGEVCMMRTADVNTSGKVWTFTPPVHKLSYRGISRTIYLGKRAQEVLAPFLRTELEAFIFSPRQSEAERRERMHAERVTPMCCGNIPGSNVKHQPRKQPGESYDTQAYGKAIAFACERAWPVPEGLDAASAKAWRREHRWHPNQLRHSFATRVRREHGLEAAQVLLGHATADITQIYAERDEAKGLEVALKIG